MPETVFDEVFENGVLKSRTPRTVSDAEIERRDAPANLRIAIAALTAWQDDAKTEADLVAMTAAQRIARQAIIEDRFAKLSRIVRRILVAQGLDQ